MIKKMMALILCVMVLFPTAAFGEMAVPSKLDAPANLKVELKKYEDGKPYLYMEFKIPQSILELDSERPGDGSVNFEIDKKIDNEEWEIASNGMGNGGGLDALGIVDEGSSIYSFEDELLDEGGITTIDIKAHTYAYRVRFFYTYTDADGNFHDRDFTSPFSNVVTIGTGAYYKGASPWAVAELNRAQEYGFITDKIKGNMSGPITREEFAEVAVKLYEKYTGKTAGYADMSAFVDTQNPEIFKAYNLNIVKGTNIQKKLFSPKALTNREQVAVMLFNAVKALKPGADLSTTGAPSFADEKQISGWALNNVKFMSKNGFILGSNGKFSPKGTCTREQAVLIAVRVYEKYAGITHER